MTHESKQFFKKYWQAILIFSTCQFLLTFFGNIGANKVRDYRTSQLENNLSLFKVEIKKELGDFKQDIAPRVDLLSWMHDIGTRGGDNLDSHSH